ncbi:MAG: fluoride efflux transporter CrcB [Rhodobacteraceae bacterium]|nr:fluoride efflux transporter CrcB [Paracoccaceae bacterium]
MAAYVWIGLGSALGGMARHAVGAWSLALFGAAFPWGTLVVNIAGSAIIGAVAALASSGEGPAPLGETARLFLAVGVCGGFTTFSAFSLQTLNLIEAGSFVAALTNVGTSVIACLAAVWVGYHAVQTLT